MRRLLVAAAVVALALVALLRHRPPRPARDLSQSGRSARNTHLAKVGTRASANYAVHSARRAFASAERRQAMDHEFELKTAAQVVEALGEMKGAMMKIGQMASYLDSGMPAHVREALAALQADAPPMSAELAAGQIRDELGALPTELFAEWDPVPIASASIGQVHRAITTDDRAVAVKVQYPGIGEAIRADLDNADMMFQAMGVMFPGLDPGPLVDELKLRLGEELDYRLEAEHQLLFADYYQGHPYITVPAVLPEYSTERVLTTELAPGARWEELVEWSQEERNLAAETIYRFVFGSLYRLGLFNGDPHPGNYLFEPGGHVTFLDFGLCKRFTDDEIEIFNEMIRQMVLERDPAGFRSVIEEVGLLAPDAPVDDETIMEYFSHFYELVIEDEVMTVTDDYASSTVRHVFDPTGGQRDVQRIANVPPSFVIIQRINLGLVALLGQLAATANWRRLAEEIWPFVDAPPSTPMGRDCQVWAQSRRGWTASNPARMGRARSVGV